MSTNESEPVNIAPVLADAMRKFGIGSQLMKSIEEMSELTQALLHWFIGKDKDTDHVHEEIADVLIMLGQLQLFFDRFKTHEIVMEKVHRLEESLKDYPNCPQCGENPADAIFGICSDCFKGKRFAVRMSHN